VKGRNGVKVFDYIAQNKQNVFGKIKIVVLINKGSASASEILAGCLKDYNIAKLIGETTFGKALVQEVFKLNNNKGAVKITTGQYHTPSDKQINGIGITPDIFVQENINKHYDAILQTGIRYIEQNEKNE
jgi:carboxyl-terminal processing protease